MKCPICNENEDKVIETRSIGNGSSIRRRRQCNKCGYRFTSYEHVEEKKIMVIKCKNNNREEFSKNKMINGIYKSLEKRPIPNKIIEETLQNIEDEISILAAHNNFEIKSNQIGKTILKHLKKIDEVAYIRFASVYRKFEDVSQFINEIESLNK